MGKRGPKPEGKVKIKWSSDFCYALGLIATDGCLYSDGLHISFGSKDIEQIKNFTRCLGVKNKIGMNIAGSRKSYSYRVQFGDVIFYKFLISIGITSNKSKTIKKVDIPSKYFFDFLRGCFDGDGYVHSYYDPRWKNSFLWYVGFCSASQSFLDWIRSELQSRLLIKGHITKSKNNSCMQLKYAKREAIKIVEKMYYRDDVTCLGRKKLKIKVISDIVSQLGIIKK